MRLAAFFKKTMLENFRDWKILVLILTFAPFFVLLMHAYLESAAKTYKTFKVIVLNGDRGAKEAGGGDLRAGNKLLEAMAQLKYPDGVAVMALEGESDLERARQRVAAKEVDLAVVIPADFSETLRDFGAGKRVPAAKFSTYGDAGNPKYMLAAAYCDYLAYEFAAAAARFSGPLDIQAKSAGRPSALTDFELYVPALLALAVMMLMFTAAASLIKEKDKETIVRLRMSRLKVWEWLSAVGLAQLLIGLLALGLTLLTALALGYRTSGSLPAAIAVGGMACLSVIAISLIVAAWLRTIFDLMTVGCFPFFVLMFFSGGMFPLPPLALGTIAGRAIQATDILPTTHAISAMNKVLNQGAGLGGVAYEMAAMALLTVAYFIVGLLWFRRRHLTLK